MIIKIKVLFGLCLCIMFSCSNDDDSSSYEPIETGNQISVYPKPPSQWMGETDPYYTAGYVGDVMPYFDNGKFNLFFLHDAKTKPAGEGFHDIHSFESSDLISFDYNGRMIPYGTNQEADFAIGTGSVVKVGDIYYFYYTGHNGNLNPRESVLCATSTDLKNWTKLSDFKLTAPSGYYDYDFRDPHVFYNEEAGSYWMLMSTQTEPGRKAVILLFTSDDPVKNNWIAQAPIYTTSPEENYLMMECADMFKMGDYWYLIFSENWSDYTGTRYRMATSSNGPWITPEVDRFDGKYLYAAKTAANGNQRYLFGWTARKTPENNTGNKDWAGNMVIHELVQNTNGTLDVKQPESVSSLFSVEKTIDVESTQGEVIENNNSYVLNGVSESALVSFTSLKKSNRIQFEFSTDSDGESGLLLNYESEPNNAFKIAFDPANNRISAYQIEVGNAQYINHIPFEFNDSEIYDVVVTLNGDVCVVYINNQRAFSNRLYNVSGKKWGLFAVNSQVEFSNVILKNPY